MRRLGGGGGGRRARRLIHVLVRLYLETTRATPAPTAATTTPPATMLSAIPAVAVLAAAAFATTTATPTPAFAALRALALPADYWRSGSTGCRLDARTEVRIHFHDADLWNLRDRLAGPAAAAGAATETSTTAARRLATDSRLLLAVGRWRC